MLVTKNLSQVWLPCISSIVVSWLGCKFALRRIWRQSSGLWNNRSSFLSVGQLMKLMTWSWETCSLYTLPKPPPLVKKESEQNGSEVTSYTPADVNNNAEKPTIGILFALSFVDSKLQKKILVESGKENYLSNQANTQPRPHWRSPNPVAKWRTPTSVPSQVSRSIMQREEFRSQTNWSHQCLNSVLRRSHLLFQVSECDVYVLRRVHWCYLGLIRAFSYSFRGASSPKSLAGNFKILRYDPKATVWRHLMHQWSSILHWTILLWKDLDDKWS